MTTPTSERTKLTIRLADDIHDVPVSKIAKKLKRKFGLTVLDVLAERAGD